MNILMKLRKSIVYTLQSLELHELLNTDNMKIYCKIEIIRKYDYDNNMINDDANNDVKNTESAFFVLNLEPNEIEVFYNPELHDKGYTVFRNFWYKNTKWKLVCYPNGKTEEDAGYISMSLHLSDADANLDLIGNEINIRWWWYTDQGKYGYATDAQYRSIGHGITHSTKLHRKRFTKMKCRDISFECHIQIVDISNIKDQKLPLNISKEYVEELIEQINKLKENLSLNNLYPNQITPGQNNEIDIESIRQQIEMQIRDNINHKLLH